MISRGNGIQVWIRCNSRAGVRCWESRLPRNRKLLDFHRYHLSRGYMMRLSMTRFALPSLRCRVRGATSFNGGRRPVMPSMEWTSRFCICSRAPTVSLNASAVTSTCTSKRVQILLAVHDDLVMRQRALHFQQRGFDLRGEQVDAADNEHVVAAPANAADAPERAAADAAAGFERRDIARPVADHRHGALAEGRQHQFVLRRRPATVRAFSDQ